MARTTSREADPPPQKSRRRTKLSTRGLQQIKDSHGPDPWGSFNCFQAGTAAGSASLPDAQSTTGTSLRSRRVSRLSRERQGTKDKPASATETKKAADEDDDVAIPTPIQAILPWKIVAPDGRTRDIHAPIPGFEHLFEDSDGCQEASSTSRSSNAVQLAYQPQQSQAPVTPQQKPADGNSQQRRSKTPAGIKVPSKKNAILKSTKSNVLKRSHSIAQGLTHLQPSSAREATDDEGNDDKIKKDGDKPDDEVQVITEAARTFQIGDIEALKIFLRQRVDELTMKPVRGMVTSWVRLLEPKRKGGYGPYHKKLPHEAPDDATPPWWPRDVPYVEPAHLDKFGLLTLAVDIIMQHRDIPIDAFKRSQAWTHKLRQVAQFEIEMTPADQYSSSRNPVFSSLMKERAEKEILPSLFDISQSYEDHVNQYCLWSCKNIKDAPQGKTVMWQLVPRPPKQSTRAKRPRPAPRPRVKRENIKIEAVVESSGDDTEPDDTMYKLAAHIVRKREARDAKEAQRKAKAAAESQTPIAQVPSRSAEQTSREQTVEAPSPTVATQASVPQTPQANPQQATDPNLDDAKPVVSSSFDQSMDHLRLQDSAAEGRSLPLEQQDDVKEVHVNPTSDMRQAPIDLQLVNERLNYQGFTNNTYHSPQGRGPFTNPDRSPYTHFTPHNFIDLTELSMFNPTQMQMGLPFDHTLASNNMHMAYPYVPDGTYNPMDGTMSAAMSGMSPAATASFGGLPYEFQASQH